MLHFPPRPEQHWCVCVYTDHLLTSIVLIEIQHMVINAKGLTHVVAIRVSIKGLDLLIFAVSLYYRIIYPGFMLMSFN